ncbi:hypothetical protein DCAR_0519632 [Daucus carota subsp. sativus]|uniref:Uncharacterized protein n=1 Tax=Daucus carota subsp. sativus TaxID=79200 RepID=A0AAF0X2C0_DAUCS|nr:hypothetical protein DCAR_0519632 [Daucus carota subsp. sativus]
MNFHLKKAGYVKEVTNFSPDLKEVNELVKVDQVLELMGFVGSDISKIAQADNSGFWVHEI